MYKLKSFRVTVILLWITAVLAALMFMMSCGQANPCTEIQHRDSIVYADAEYIIDSLIERNTALEAAVAGYKMQDHSKISTGNDLLEKNYDTNGHLTVITYTDTDGRKYRLHRVD